MGNARKEGRMKMRIPKEDYEAYEFVDSFDDEQCDFDKESPEEVCPPMYSIGIWDADLQAYIPPKDIGNCINITRSELRERMRQLRDIGYSVHRRRDADGTHDDNDWRVLIEKTDGKPEIAILEDWKR